ncbi:MAG: hypothetical protein ACR2NZ_15320, partial [Rubripirellula sp.]
GAHNMVTAMGINRLDLLAWFNGVLLEYSVCFFVALALKPFVLVWSGRASGRPTFGLSDAMWLTFAAAMLLVAWSRFEPPAGFFWPLTRYISTALLAASIIIVASCKRRAWGIAILLLASISQYVAIQKMKTPAYDLLPGGMSSLEIQDPFRFDCADRVTAHR